MSACRNRASPIQRFSSTRMRCITAICPAGPPKESAATPGPGAHRLGEGDAVLARHPLLVGDGAASDLARADHRRLLRKWGVEVREHRPAAGEALLVVVAGRRADAGDQAS